ncbi:MAG: type VI secretion system baseplate subunit TssG [Azospirillaceae bacterium]|nr:type VI secretion system baseplate subunit TssG [Azospirillaceae bacterium]
MAKVRRQATRSLIQGLQAEPWLFDWLQAISLLERAAADWAPVGTGIDPDREAVRLEFVTTLAFPPSDVSAAHREPSGRGVVRSPVLGLTGFAGPLPASVTDMMLDRASRRDRGALVFLDIFNHRLMSIFFRVRQSSQPLLERHPESGLIARTLRSLSGLGTPWLRPQLPPVLDRMLPCFTGMLAGRVRSAAGLEQMITTIFGIGVTVHNFVGRWLPLGDDVQTVVGGGANGRNNRLGSETVIGRRVWDQQSCFEIALRVDSLARYRDFLPTGRHYDTLVALARFYSGDGLDFRLTLELPAASVPPTRLSARGGNPLGWMSWLRNPALAGRAPGRVTLFPAKALGGFP